MMQNEQNLIWIDLEMTGLDPQTDRIIEIATIVTDPQLAILAEGPVIAIFQEEDILNDMDDWNTRHHTDSGLLDRVRVSRYSEQQAAAETMEFLKKWVPAGK
ncbi:MAG: oligoribonuclease, partial [Gammaproteobacteria bacterium]|nr:oligoribonuclease [Gammaproteobacteria bacterium]